MTKDIYLILHWRKVTALARHTSDCTYIVSCLRVHQKIPSQTTRTASALNLGVRL